MLNVRENVPLAPLTTFEIGGPAKYFAEVADDTEIKEALQWAKEHKVPCIIIAGGSNVLMPDDGLNALVIRVAGNDFAFEGDRLDAHPGCNLLSLIRTASERGLGGWEKLAGIPGTIGGAVRGNAGAFGPEIKDFVTSVRAFNSGTDEYRDFVSPDIDFSYRHSFFKDHPEWIILRVTLQLQEIHAAASAKLVADTISEREKRHIQNVRAAGSYFMNPVAPPAVREMFENEKKAASRGGRVPAGWLIEKAGMKGARIGGAIASEQHPNYIKNDGDAKAIDVLALAKKIKDAVREQFGVELKEEAVILT